MSNEEMVNKRKPTKFNACRWFMCLGDHKAKKLFNEATEVIAREIDVVEFIKHQLLDSLHRSLVFTQEREKTPAQPVSTICVG